MPVLRMLLGALSDVLDQHQKRVEATGEAFLSTIGKMPTPQSENRPIEMPAGAADPLHSRSQTTVTGQGIQSPFEPNPQLPSGNDYHACHTRAWAAGNKQFDSNDWRNATGDHSPGCFTPLTIPQRNHWLVRYEDAVCSSSVCDLCWLITVVTDRYSDRIGGDDHVVIAVANHTHIPDDCLDIATMTLIRKPLANGQATSLDSSLFVRLYYPAPDQYFARLLLPVRRPLALNPLSESCIGWAIRSWQTCLQTHKECAGTPYPRSLDVVPARCLYIGKTAGSVMRVVDTNIHQLRYVALSYCWGKGSTLTLTSATMHAFKINIAWSSMPKTYQQAILITRMLGFEYLWIDSICIIQEGGPDWQTESAKMGDVYRNAEIVLSGDSGNDTDSGFCFDRDKSWTSPDRIDLPPRPDGPSHLNVLTCSLVPGEPYPWAGQMFSQPVDHYMHDSSQDVPVGERAWCFQEWYSATRIIHFKRNELVWECKATVACECGTTSQPWTLSQKFGYKYKTGKQKFHQSLVDCKSLEDLSWIWSDVVNEYSKRDLGVEMDRLPALSGVARQMAHPLLGEYLGGLWRNELPAALLWWRLGIPEGLGRPAKYRGPSWCWPAMLSGVRYQRVDRSERYVARVIRAECQVPDRARNPYGCVSSGSLTISAPIFNARLIPTVDSDSQTRGRGMTAAHPFSSREASLSLPNWTGDGSGFHADLDWTIAGRGQDVLCVMVKRHRNDDYDEKLEECEALIVVPVALPGPGRTEQTYQRVGLARFEFRGRFRWSMHAPTRTITII